MGNEREAILVDAGISCREIEKRMKRLGLHIQKVKAVFISHEHYDHIKGVRVLSKKYNLPVYTTTTTQSRCGFHLEEHLAMNFNTGKQINIGSLSVTPFSKLHDACDPCSFVVSSGKLRVGVFTDIGSACKNVISHFQKCHAVFLEANYDETMLDEGNYPYHLKRRIKGGLGHLSNKQALDLFLNHKPAYMSHLFLSHLSKNNNRPQLVEELFNLHAEGVKIIIATRYEETPVYQIRTTFGTRKSITVSTRQLEFSFV